MSAKRVNSRSSANLSLKRWQLRGLSDILLPTHDYLSGTQQIAPDAAHLHVVGSIKFPHQKPQIAPEREADLHTWIEAATAGAPLFVAGSTHETEEEFVLDALEFVRARSGNRVPTVLIAPRKPDRAGEILAMMQARGLRVSRRSNPTPGPHDVLLLDTLGELSLAYKWGWGAFVGGTVQGDSHNVAEPLIWSVPVAYGPRRGNFGVEQQLCEEAGVGFRVHTPEELAAHWTELLRSSTFRMELGQKVDALVKSQNNAFERTLQILIDAVDNAN